MAKRRRRVREVIRKVGEAIASGPIDIAFAGIGENGHLAFNDPPADFETRAPYLVVKLDEACRMQQVGEGWFGGLGEVPVEAISMSVRQIHGCAGNHRCGAGRAQGRGGEDMFRGRDLADGSGFDFAFPRSRRRFTSTGIQRLAQRTDARSIRGASMTRRPGLRSTAQRANGGSAPAEFRTALVDWRDSVCVHGHQLYRPADAVDSRAISEAGFSLDEHRLREHRDRVSRWRIRLGRRFAGGRSIVSARDAD